MINKIFYIILIILIPLSNACAKSNLKPLIHSIYNAAQKKDISYFEKYLSSKEQITKMMHMISKSSMPQNYKSRIKNRTKDSLQLDYHWFEKSLHFQIILKKSNSKWEVERMFICR